MVNILSSTCVLFVVGIVTLGVNNYLNTVSRSFIWILAIIIQWCVIKWHYLLKTKNRISDKEEKLDLVRQRLDSAESEFIHYQSLLDDMSKKIRIAAAEKNEEKKAVAENHIVLKEIEKQEIKKIREIEQYFKDSSIVGKLIWKQYYETPCSNLISDLHAESVTGIYKITNINNGKIYIGQAVNIGERWKKHIKCGLGAEGIKNNDLYKAMKEEGVENFAFEILEICSSENLNHSEKFWINYFGCVDLGYNMRIG